MTRKEIENKILSIMMIAIILTTILGGLVLVFENNETFTPEYVTVTDVLVAKQSEQESLNNFGDFRNNYYFLYESGELEKVTLEDYMSFKEGDTIINYKVKDERE